MQHIRLGGQIVFFLSCHAMPCARSAGLVWSAAAAAASFVYSVVNDRIGGERRVKGER